MKKMANEYNVDDILAEVLGERATKKPASASFNVTIEEKPQEAEAPKKEEAPAKPEGVLHMFDDDSATRPMNQQELSSEVK